MIVVTENSTWLKAFLMYGVKYNIYKNEGANVSDGQSYVHSH